MLISVSDSRALNYYVSLSPSTLHCLEVSSRFDVGRRLAPWVTGDKVGFVTTSSNDMKEMIAKSLGFTPLQGPIMSCCRSLVLLYASSFTSHSMDIFIFSTSL